jgi:hypothetical protein
MKLKITTAFPASKRFYLPPLVGLFVLCATAHAQYSTTQPLAPPVQSTSQLAMTNSFQLFAAQPAASAPGGYQPFKWDQFVVRPHVDYQFTKAYHLPAAPSNLVDTTIQRFSPGILFNLGPHWALDYTLTIGLYSDTNFGTEVDHSITLSGHTIYGAWDFGFLQTVNLTQSPMIQFGGQQDQQYFDTSLTGHHENSQYISEDIALSQNIQAFPGGGYENMKSWSVLAWLNYQPQSHISFGIGPGIGYNYALFGPDSVFEQLQARMSWRINDVLSLQISGGVSETEFIGSGDFHDIFSPIYSGSLEFRPFPQTGVSLYASRYVSPSVLVDQYTEGTSAGVSITQRLLQQFYLTANASYGNEKYVAPTVLALDQIGTNTFELEQINLGRTDKFYNFSLRLNRSFLQRGNISIFYSYNSDQSTAPGYSFAGNQFGGEVSYSF